MVCWMTRNGWLVGCHGLLDDKKWLAGWGPWVIVLREMVGWLRGHGLLDDKKWLAGWVPWFVG